MYVWHFDEYFCDRETDQGTSGFAFVFRWIWHVSKADRQNFYNVSFAFEKLTKYMSSKATAEHD